MGNWAIIVPETAEVTNLVINPSGELGTNAEYTAVASGTLDVVETAGKARRGAHGFSYTPTSNTGDGVYYGTVSLTSGIAYTFSVDVLGVLGVTYKIYFANTSATLLGTATSFTGTGVWQRVSVTYTEVSSTTRRLYITKDNSANTGAFYFDGLMCTALGYVIEYFDGDSDGGKWTGTAHASTSILDPQWRQGGREINFSSYSVTVLSEAGIGMPSAQHLTVSQALLPGAEFLGRKEMPRTISLRCQIKGSDWDGLHSLRKALINAIKPDLISGDQPITLRYYGANSSIPLDLSCVYDSGLEMGNPEMYLEEFDLRLIAYDPFWQVPYETSFPLATAGSHTMRYFGCKQDKQWTSITPSAMTDPGSGITVRAICRASDGKIYVGGRFTNGDGNANCDYIMYYDPSTATWNAMGTGTNGYVRDIVESNDGGIFVGGEFTLAGGVAGTAYIAKWGGWEGAGWWPLGTGMNGNVYGLKWCPPIGSLTDSLLFVTGNFTIGDGTSCNRIAYWSGLDFVALGTGLNLPGEDIAFDNAGNLYVCGNFTTANGVTCNRIAKWNGTTFDPLGTGMDDFVFKIEFGPDGKLYAVGYFTTADGSAAAKCAYWNGAAWFPMGSGLAGGNAYSMAIDDDGLVYAGGAFTSAGGLALADRLAVWNGSTWAQGDIDLPGSATLYVITIKGEDIYLGFSTSGTAYHSYLYTINNPGTLTARPRLKIYNAPYPGVSPTLKYIKNEETGATLWLNYLVNPLETVEIDFSLGKKTVESDYYGAIWRGILRGSDFGEFGLLPGNNRISVFISTAGSPATYYASLIWHPIYWSADGAAV